MKTAKRYALTTLGVIILSLSIKFFLEPNKIASGGVTGIAIIINDINPKLPVGFLMLAMNIILFMVAFIAIGGKFGGITIYASLSLSGLTWALDNVFPKGVAATNNLLLAAIFGTLISGIGMGIVFNQNASTGGTDILAKILNKFIHIDIGKALLLVDFTVTLFGGLTLGAELGMYSLLAVIINGFVIDTVIEGLNICKQVMVISSENKKISDYIIKELDRGCTVVTGKGGYTGNDTYILYTVISRKEFIKLRDYIKEVDKFAFITVSDVREVLGEGFKDIAED